MVRDGQRPLGPTQAIGGCADCGDRCSAQAPQESGLGSAQRNRGLTHRAASGSADSRRALCNRRGAAFLIPSPRQQAWRRDYRGGGQTQDVALVQSRTRIPHARPGEGDRFEFSIRGNEPSKRDRACGLGFEELEARDCEREGGVTRESLAQNLRGAAPDVPVPRREETGPSPRRQTHGARRGVTFGQWLRENVSTNATRRQISRASTAA